MRIISKKTLRKFWERYPDAKKGLDSWYHEVKRENWDSPAKVKARYNDARIIGGNRVVFKINGNKYRLVVEITYKYRVVYICFVGTHAEYDSINVKEV